MRIRPVYTTARASTSRAAKRKEYSWQTDMTTNAFVLQDIVVKIVKVHCFTRSDYYTTYKISRFLRKTSIYRKCETRFLKTVSSFIETNLAACSSGPCKNNGFCFDASSESHKRHLAHADDYECFCQNGFSGKDCECKFVSFIGQFPLVEISSNKCNVRK